ncbi:MAG: DUF1330 domain-containing protein [Vicinamibacterales bacterium]
MAVYAICSYDIADAKGYEPYVPSVLPILQKHGAEILAADFGAKVLEGRPPSVQVILKFENEEAVLRWYQDPEYAEIRRIRLDSTSNGSLVLVRPSGTA